MTFAFGLDFGTTNSLVAYVAGDAAISLLDDSNRPHPSVVWFRGSDVVVGRAARQNMDVTEGGAPPGFVRSPKMALRKNNPISAHGKSLDPAEVVAKVLAHLKADAAIPRREAINELVRAVFTIPVNFGGAQRRALRDAARRAGIGVVQFVHEPAAALYAYIRSQPNFEQFLARLQGRPILVFDWGGGTLDLTLCKIIDRTILQIANAGDDEVGGDRFDERLRNQLRAKHAARFGLADVLALEQPGMAAKLLHQCEELKIRLSTEGGEEDEAFVRDYVRAEGPARHLRETISKEELEAESADIVAAGLGQIDRLLERAGMSYQDVEFCLATGGMVNIPAIRRGLIERFVGRVPPLANGDRIIAEGAAWIAHDGLRLTLSKPVEILVADTSGSGTYYPLVAAGWPLPMENEIHAVANTRLFCTDPREGVAVVECAKPVHLGSGGIRDARSALCIASVNVDPNGSPLVERVDCRLTIDHDYVACLSLRSTGIEDETSIEFHDLEFGLTLPNSSNAHTEQSSAREASPVTINVANLSEAAGSRLFQRSNVGLASEGSSDDDLLSLVPGDIVRRWRPRYFDSQSNIATFRQKLERDFYQLCARCKRKDSQINAQGPVAECFIHSCGYHLA
jgi:molecular chaperone DnaK